MMSSSSSRRSSVGSDFRRSIHNHNNSGMGDVIVENQAGNGDSECDGIFKIPIIGYEVMDERARFTAFKLRVENEKANESWLVFRRYTDFERLCAKLKDEHPTLPINLPPKRWLRDNFDTIFLDDRMKGLQAFVDCILVQHKLGNTATVRDFFCLDEPPLYPENAEESKAIFGTLEENLSLLKDALQERDTENELLKAELALVKTQLENLSRLTRNCRHCNHRMSLPLSPLHKSDNSPIPVASSTPNNADSSPRSRVSSFNHGYQSPGTPKAKNTLLAAGVSALSLNGKCQLFPTQLEAVKVESPQTKAITSKTSHIIATSENSPTSTYAKSSPSSSERMDSSPEKYDVAEKGDSKPDSPVVPVNKDSDSMGSTEDQI